MNDILLAARLILALVFLVAGLTKLADLAGSRRAMVGFGLPPVVAKPAGLLLPLVELVVAVSLIPTRTTWAASLAAAGLLLIFIGGIAVNLIRGRTPDCHCFGQLHSEPIGIGTIARNSVLLVPALFIAVAGRIDAGPNALAWVTGLGAPDQIGLIIAAIGFALLLLQWSLLLNLMRQNGRMLVRIEALEAGGPPTALPEPAAPAIGLAAGTPAPPFTLPGLHGETMTLPALLAQGSPTLLLFTSAKCGPCSALLPDVAGWQREVRDKLTIALIAEGALEANRAKAEEHGLANVLVQEGRAVSELYMVNGTPSAVLVGIDGAVVRTLAVGGPAIHALVGDVLGAPAVPAIAKGSPSPNPAQVIPLQDQAPSSNGHHRIKTGDPAPDFQLPDLAGKSVSLSDFRGHDTLLLFWNTGCGFCKRMLPDLKGWESERTPDSPGLVVVSCGSTEDMRAMELRSPVLVDEGFTTGPLFGANGTPMGILIDDKGKIASEMAVGAEAVLTLARSVPTAAGP